MDNEKYLATQPLSVVVLSLEASFLSTCEQFAWLTKHDKMYPKLGLEVFMSTHRHAIEAGYITAIPDRRKKCVECDLIHEGYSLTDMGRGYVRGYHTGLKHE